jgi:hypothetical protein
MKVCAKAGGFPKISKDLCQVVNIFSRWFNEDSRIIRVERSPESCCFTPKFGEQVSSSRLVI